MVRIAQIVGLSLALAGAWLLLEPNEVRRFLGWPHLTEIEQTHFAAQFGGLCTGFGIGLVVASVVHGRFRWIVHLVLWSMLGMALARLYLTAGLPTLRSLHYGWIITELALSAGAALYLIRRRRYEAWRKHVLSSTVDEHDPSIGSRHR